MDQKESYRIRTHKEELIAEFKAAFPPDTPIDYNVFEWLIEKIGSLEAEVYKPNSLKFITED